MNAKANIAPIIIIAGVALLFAAVPNGRAQPNGPRHASDFTSTEYYESPHQQQIKSILSGAEALPQPGGRLIVKQLKLETFNLDGKLEITIMAPECIYDTFKGLANSPGHLQVQTGDGRIHLEGDGFLWRQSDSFLTISNNVRTVIENISERKAAAAPNTPAAKSQTRISSDGGEFDVTRRRVTYHGHVWLDDPEVKLAGEWLITDLPQADGHVSHIVAETNVVIDSMGDKGQTNHATCARAVYNYEVKDGTTNELVTLTGNAKVENTEYVLSGEPITWNRANNLITAIHQLIIPRKSLINANASTPSPPAAPNTPGAESQTRISSDWGEFDMTGRRATCHGHVRVDDPEMKLTSEWLITELPRADEHVSHIVAETNVVIDFTDEKGQTNHATGDKAVYVYSESGGVTNETVTLTGNPQMENAQGTQAGDVIIWDRANNKIHFDNPHLIFRQNLTGATTDTNPPVTVVKTNFPPGTVENIDKNISNPVNSSPKF